MSELELQDAILRHALELQRLSAHDEAEALRILEALEADLRALMASKSLPDSSVREINALIRDARGAIDARYSDLGKVVDIDGIMVMISEKTTATLENVIASARLPSAIRLASLAKDILIDGAPSSAWWAKQSGDLAFRFAREVREGMLLDETQEQIVTRIVGRRNEPGILDTARSHARSLVHSSVMTAANRARLETYRSNSRHIGSLKWLATLDSRTCVQCAALDGSTWDLEGNPTGETKLQFTLPPAHFSCRCVISPQGKGLDAILGTTGLDAQLERTRTRASAKGSTDARTFAEFLKRQDAQFVEDMLGKRRADLYLAGKLGLQDLISKAGRPLTLDQIRARS